MPIASRTLASLLALGAAATFAAAPAATAAPSTGSAGGSSSFSGCGPRTAADYRFLEDSFFDDESCSVQDSAIRLAHSSCSWLDTYGGTARNRLILADELSDTLDYPHSFVRAATVNYCPHNAR